jgi:hypothetical protein
MSALKKVAVVAVGEWSPQQEEPSHRKIMLRVETSEGRNGDTLLGSSR